MRVCAYITLMKSREINTSFLVNEQEHSQLDEISFGLKISKAKILRFLLKKAYEDFQRGKLTKENLNGK